MRYVARDQPRYYCEMRHVNELDIVAYAFFCDGTSDGRALHFTLGVDYDTGVVLKHKLRIGRVR